MKPINQKFKTGDKLEINAVENGFIIVHKAYPKAMLRPMRHPSVIGNGIDEDFEDAEFDSPRCTKCYIAENKSEVTNIISEILSKEEKLA